MRGILDHRLPARLVLGLGMLCLIARGSGSATFDVDDTADLPDAGDDGKCLTLAGTCTLRAALQEANRHADPDLVRLQTGQRVYRLTGDSWEDAAASGDLDIVHDLTVQGYGRDASVIDGGVVDRVFEIFAGASVTLENLAITNGTQGAANGAGIHSAGSLVLSGVAVLDNAGIGVYANGGSTGRLEIIDSYIAGNQAGRGGGVWTNTLSFIDRTTITNNRGFDSNLNTGLGEGGGIFVQGNSGIVEIRNSTISGNRVQWKGAGLDVVGGRVTLNNVTITNNVADIDGVNGGVGGGLVVFDATVTFSNTIVVGNIVNGSATRVGADAYVFRDSGATLVSGGFDLVNALAACPNAAAPCDMGSAAVSGDVGTLVFRADPGLGPLADNGGATHPLTLFPLEGSAAREAGSPAPPGSGGAACEATDQRRIERPGSPGRCDIGAVQATFPSPVCGNGVREGDEKCDQGSDNSDTISNRCRTDCNLASCGDGVTDLGEVCDDGGDPRGCCDANCRPDPA